MNRDTRQKGSAPLLKVLNDNKKKLQVLETGATRIPVEEHFHYICPELERRVALICAEGFAAYPDKEVPYAELSTGRKGLPLANHMKHARRHFNKWLKGDRTEDHLAKVAWAIMSIMHDESNPECEHFNMLLKPEHQIRKYGKGDFVKI